jgi:hypothetical protein
MKSVNGYVELYNTTYEPLTFRELVAKYVGKRTWVMFGIDLIFGAESDKVAGEMHSMFLPEMLMEEFRESRIWDLNETSRQLVVNQNVLVEKQDKISVSDTQNFSVPFIVFLLLMLVRLIFFVLELKKPHKKIRFFDTPFLLASGLIGCVAFYLTFISMHPMVGENFNLLWLIPLHIIAAVLLWFRSMRKILFFYFILTALMILFSFYIYISDIQAINYTFMPIMLTLTIIYTSWINRGSRKFRKKTKKQRIGF